MNTELVEWQPVPNAEEFFICNNYGIVKRLRDGKIMKPWKDLDGYLNIDISAGGKRVKWKVSRMVAFLFVIGYNKDLDVNHIDFDKSNNFYLNLNYKTKAENIIHSTSSGRFKNNSDHFKKRTWRQRNVTIQTDLYGVLIKEHNSLSDAAKYISGTKSMISRAIIGRSKTAYGYKWQYKI